LSDDKVGILKRFTNNLFGKPNPSTYYGMEGYLVEEVGPVVFEGKGKDTVLTEAAKIVAHVKMLKEKGSNGGCPMAF
jgi:hypothetical protein